MDLEQAITAMKADLAAIAAARQDELDARNATSGEDLERLILDLFPGVSSDFIAANGHFSNELRKAISKIVTNARNAKLQWQQDSETELNDAPLQTLLKGAQQLIEDAATDALCAGKLAFFPYRDEPGGPVRIAVLTGFLHALTDPGNVTQTLGVLQVTTYKTAGRTKFEVRRFTPGLLEVFRDLDDWQKYTDATPEPYPQPHATGRLPVAVSYTHLTLPTNREV